MKDGDRVTLVSEYLYEGKTQAEHNGTIDIVPVGTSGYISDIVTGQVATVVWDLVDDEDQELDVDITCLRLETPVPDLTNLEEVSQWLDT